MNNRAEHIKQTIGIVAIGRNEGERLIRCMNSLKATGRPVVYVDSGSTDNSCAAAEERGATVVHLDMSKPFSMPRARNAGFHALKLLQPELCFVQFVDGDCELAEEWLPAALNTMEEQPRTAAICGRRRELYPEHSIYNRLCDIEWNTPVGLVKACGGDALMRVAAFEEVQGFNEALIAGEEPELCLRFRNQQWNILRIDCEMTRHDANILTFSAWWKRNIRGGYGALDVVERLKDQVPKSDIPFAGMTSSAITWTRNVSIAALLLMLIGSLLAGTVGAIIGLLASGGIVLLQALRIARGIRPRAASTADALCYGVFTMLAKWAQAWGQHRYRRDRKSNRAAKLIEYKTNPTTVSAWQQDKARYPEHAFLREQSLWAIAVYRYGRTNDARPTGIIRTINDKLYWLLFRITETLTGIGLTKLTTVGPGLRIYHFGNIFIHSDVAIGANCTLRQGCTIGNREEGGPVPVLEDDVELGAYAQVLGGITIGRGAKIGAMSVVLQDVPPGATAVGIPARILLPKKPSTEPLHRE